VSGAHLRPDEVEAKQRLTWAHLPRDCQVLHQELEACSRAAPQGEGDYECGSCSLRDLSDDELVQEMKEVCVYVYMCVCVCVCVSVCIYICMVACMKLCMYVHTCYVLTKPPIPSSRCKCFVFLRPV
jgi:hypothetical protein